MRHAPAAELLPLPPHGRRYTAQRTARLGDVDPRGAVRFDAIARLLQDVATDDADDCGLDASFGWVVRRTMVDVERQARLRETLELTTFCTGSGRSWAERRTSITGDRGAAIEAVSLWVQVDLTTGRPAPLNDNFHEIYGEVAGARQVSTRLSLAGPPEREIASRPWSVRRVDLDPFAHVNNAVHWAALEEVLDGRRRGRAEIEFAVPIDFDTAVDLVTVTDEGGTAVWLTAAGVVHTALRFTS